MFMCLWIFLIYHIKYLLFLIYYVDYTFYYGNIHIIILKIVYLSVSIFIWFDTQSYI